MKSFNLLLGSLLLAGFTFTTSVAGSISEAGDGPFGPDRDQPRVLLVSSLVDNADSLAGAAAKEVLVLRYDPRETSLEELEGMIRETLRGRRAASIAFAVHDHGENRFYLTSSASVSLPSTLANAAQRDFWRKIGDMITEDGRVDLLACNLASGDNGTLLMASLENAANRNFAASTNPTGNIRAGGDWLLETDGIDAAGEYFNIAKLDSYAGLLWSSEQKLTASDAESGDQFGTASAIDGNYAIVGAPYEDDGGDSAGAAYIFYNNNGTWTQMTKLVGETAGDDFGYSVGISGDYAIVGAYYEDTGGSSAGAAYIYYNDSGTWTRQTKLTGGAASDYFGGDVNISGNYAIVGATGADPGSVSSAGTAYIYYNNSGSWGLQATLMAPSLVAFDGFGVGVDIDGYYAVVGCAGRDYATSYSGEGAAFVFRNTFGDWTRVAELTASDQQESDAFGQDVAISGDYIIVGAPNEDATGNNAGAAYIFHNDSGSWSQTIKLLPSNYRSSAKFGNRVSISGDYAIAGSRGNYYAGTYAGAAFIFKNDSGTWSETKMLTASDATEYDYYGESVGISGGYAIVGTANKTVGESDNAGSVYIYNAYATVTTQAVSSIATTTATGNGTITGLGGSDLTAYGVCWNTAGNPTISGSHTDEGSASATGSFTSSITGLTANTTYYVRAYATNSIGTSYGSQVSFTTAGAEMSVRLGSAPIADGGTTSLGNYSAGTSTDVVFTISNSGGIDLLLSGTPIVSLSGSSQFSVQAQPSVASVPPGGTTTFTIRFSPVTAGAASTSVSISNNDSDENPYNFILNATGLAGSLNNIKIVNAAGGAGSEVGTLSLTADQTSTLYAAGYDLYGNYISDQSVTWGGSGVCSGNLSPVTGTSTTFTAVTAGEGTITADHATATDDTTGTITVTPGEAASFTVTTEHSGTETAGTMFSVSVTARDADDNIAAGYIGSHGLAWTWTATDSPTGVSPTKPADGNQSFTSGVAAVSGFTLTDAGETPTITATEGSVTGTSSTITVNKGTLSYVQVEDAASGAGSEVTTNTMDSADTLTVYAAGYDASGNYLADQSVTWSGTGVVSGNLSPATGTSTVFTADDAGTGTISADHATATDDTTGTITVNAILPTLTTTTASSITTATASSGGEITSDGGSSITARGVCWGTSENPTVSGSHTTNGTGDGTFTSSLTGLTEDTLYYYRAYATNDAGTAYGDELSFSTEDPPTVSTAAASSVTYSSAQLNGNLSDMGTGASVEVSFEWGTTSGGPYPNTTTAQTVSATGIFNASLTGLTEDSDYYYRAVADAGDSGTGHGSEQSFSTEDPPTVSTTTASSVTYSSAQLNGNLSDMGTGASVEVSFEWGTTSGGPYPNTTTAQTVSATGTFNASLTGLTEDSDYYYRAVADAGDSGTSYGSEQSFSTEDPPTVSTTAASSVTYSSAQLNGNLSDMGTGASVEVSFEWGTTSGGPYPNTTTAQTVSATGSFNASLTGLTEDSDYYYRAVADAGDSGTSYGSEVRISTEDPPTVSTSAAGSITATTAQLNGNLSDMGTGASVEVSFEWGQVSGGPYPNTTTAQTVSAAGTFNASLTGLSKDNTYYYRAVADGGDSGTSYGDEVSFITEEPPTVSTTAASSVTSDSAQLNGNLSNVGSASSVEVSFEWGTTSGGPYPNSTTAETVSSTGSFDAALASLSANSAYYYRAVADGGDSGISYGDEVSFSTDPALAEVVTNTTAGEVTSGSVTVSGEVVSDGGLPVIGRGFCWSPNSQPTVTPEALGEGGTPPALADQEGSSEEGSGIGQFSSTITGLRAGTTYYIRAWAENSLGVVYGNETTVTTSREGREVMGATVNEPGSQLIYLLDTGINAEERYGADANYTSDSVLQYGHGGPAYQNFISLTNTNPEQAVTVHFRYFNSDCVDFFDFLVVLTCNDTMMIDPFDFMVPGTNGVNVKDRFFGYPNREDGTGQSFDAIPASTFADGRFLLFVTASADVKTGYAPHWFEDELDPDYDYLDLIPYEFINYREEKLSAHCAAWSEGGGGDAGEELYGNYPVYGGTNGFSDENLHILNASAVSFNYLVGFQTVAKVTELGAQASYMTEAYARPAVFAEGHGGAAAMSAPLHVLLTGGERIWTEAAGGGELITGVAGEQFILRHESHAGDQWDRGEDSFGRNWVISEGGAMGWEIFPAGAMPAGNQVVNLISFMDNYNGESNLAQGAAPTVWDDVSYNIQPVVTIYTIKPFNNSEDAWIPNDPDNQPIVSPVRPESPLVTAIGVKCINTYEMAPESSLNEAVLGRKFGEFTLQDLFEMNAVVGTGSLTLEGFLGILAGSEAELANEVGPGWMRLSRWFTTRKWTTEQLYPEYVYSYWQGWDDSGEAPYELTGPTIFTAGQANYVFENFGAGKWLASMNAE